MECHHIRQAADGGDDSSDNCIPLCFDCHAEVGSYNPRHPKGSAYTESELRRHRDSWFRFCAQNPLHNSDAELNIEAYLTKSHLRGPRLEAKNLFIRFADFCAQYKTLHLSPSPNRTHELMSEISRFKMSIEDLGPLSVPGFVNLYSSAVANAWKLQRLLDREIGPNPMPIEARYKTVAENLDGLIEWFAQAKEDVKVTMNTFLAL